MASNPVLRYNKRKLMRGPAVTRLQEMINVKPDGVFGPKTEEAVRSVQKQWKLKIDGIVGPDTWKDILNRTGLLGCAFRRVEGFHSIIGEHPRPKYYGYQRCPSTITGVVLHQTGCDMPINPGGWKRVNAHFGITKEGLLIAINDPKDMIWHAQKLSRSTIGIEIEGNYRGIESEAKTFWGWKDGASPSSLDTYMIKTANVLFDWLKQYFARHGKNDFLVWGHRQATNKRPACPGEQIWKQIACPWMEKMKCTNEPYPFEGSNGFSIPLEWDPDFGEGNY